MSQRLSVRERRNAHQMRRLHAGGDLSRPNHIHQCPDRALMRSKHPPNACYTLPASHAADMKIASC
jgi:hypothetical protein